MRPRRPWLIRVSGLLIALSLVFGTILGALVPSRRAFADDRHTHDDARRRAGTVRLDVPSRPGRPLDLKPSAEGGLSGELAIVNGGKEPLIVSRVAVRGDAADPRVPPKVSVRMAEGSLPMTLAPGESRKAIVQWRPERGARQLFGHVVVTSSDEASGEVAMGVHAQVTGALGGLEGRLLAVLVGVPLLGALLTFVARLAGPKDRGALTHTIATAALAVQALLAVVVYRGLSPEMSRLDGNDGLQLIEHTVWIRSLSAEIYLGVDGLGAVALLVTSLIALFAVLSERADASVGTRPGYHAALLLLDASILGAIIAMDGISFLLFLTISVLSAAIIVGSWGRTDGASRSSVAGRMAAVCFAAVVLLAVALVAAARNADVTFLVDGTKTTTTFNIAELSRVALATKSATLFGGATHKVGFVFVLVASVVLVGSFPAHGWLVRALEIAPASGGALIAVGLPTLGVVALLRVGCMVFPEGMRWASGVVVALGAVSAAYGALGALAQTDLRRLAAYATASQAGFVLLGVGSLTPQGIAGAMVLSVTRALACGLFLVLAGAAISRTGSGELDRLTGAGSKAPGFAGAFAAAALAQAAVLGFSGAWGPLLAVFGALPNYGPLALLAALALVVLAGAHIGAFSKVAFGKGPGAELADLGSREWLAVLPLVALVVILGLWPAPVISSMTGTVRDVTFAVSPVGPEQIQ